MKEFKINEALASAKGNGLQIAKYEVRWHHNRDICKNAFESIMQHLTKCNFMAKEEYDAVIDWLADNEGKGLLMIGDCGNGKSLIAYYLIPIFLNYYLQRIYKPYTAREFCSAKIERYMPVTIVDDIGTEYKFSDFGNVRENVSELIDYCDLNGNIAVLTTNLNGKELQERYGTRTFDRLKNNCKVVVFKGNSLR